MTDDRALLEAAARAAGIELEWDWGDGPRRVVYFRGHLPNYEGWNPLEDDGDALRLAVKLSIATYPPEPRGDSATANPPGYDAPWITEPAGSDPYAATRRAIVRAAAAMAKEPQK